MTIGGGFKAIKSVLRYSAQIGPRKLWQAVNSRNACKACAFGTGGQRGGFHNESGRGIEICNKNIQAHLSDIRPGIPNTHFFSHAIEELAQLSGKQLEDLGRLASPLYKKPGERHYSPVTYAEALDLCAAQLTATAPERSFFYASGRSSNEAAFLLQTLARLYGTNNINNCSYFCHQASGVGLGDSIGTGTATIEYADLDLTDLVFVFGANPASNHPRFVKKLIDIRRRGGAVVVVNPAKEPGMVRFASPSDLRSMARGGVPIASLYIQPHLGGDLAFIQGVAKCLLDLDALDQRFMDQHTTGSDAFITGVQALDWAALEQSAGVTRALMQQVAELYAGSTRAVFTWSMGLTHHLHGVDTIQTLVGLALLRGMIGKPGAGLMPLRGHSNIQGTGSMGFTPQLKQAFEEKLQHKLGATLPQTPGLDTMACLQAAADGQMDAAFLLGGNLLAASPDTDHTRAALNRIPFKCFLNSTLNQSHVQGVDGEVIILPVRVRDEESQATTQESMFNFVRLSDGGIERFPQLWPETRIIVTLGRKLIPPARFDFAAMHDHDAIRAWIGDVVPGFTRLKDIGATKDEFHIDGRILHEPRFNTPDGKAHFHFHPLPPHTAGDFMLTSVRSEGQFNSIIYHEFDSYRDQTERWIVMVNPEDMREQGWVTNQPVDLVSATGAMRQVKVRPFDIRRGNLMVYYPEANVLVSRDQDQKSKTPGFKCVPVKVVAH